MSRGNLWFYFYLQYQDNDIVIESFPRVINSSIKSYVIFIRVDRYRIFCIEICSTILEEEYYLNEVVGKFIVSR